MNATELTSILAEYYRLNFQRKPEHMGFPTNNLFSSDEAAQRLEAWQKLSMRVDAVEKKLPPEARYAFFELVGYPVKAAAAMNEKSLAGLPSASEEIHRLTDVYNHQIANGKWRNMMSDNPRGQVDFKIPIISAADNVPVFQGQKNSNSVAAFHPAKTNFAGADFVEDNGRIVMEAEHASDFVPGKDANWQKIIGLGYNAWRFQFFRRRLPSVPSREKF